MDIRGWPLDRIMQLPDCCFGRRFAITCSVRPTAPALLWDISELALPDKTVIWQLFIHPDDFTDITCYLRLALGDQLPTTEAQMSALDPLIMGLGTQGPEPRQIHLGSQNVVYNLALRQPVQASGRRLVLESNPIVEFKAAVSVAIVISSIPTEVPDWLCSGQV